MDRLKDFFRFWRMWARTVSSMVRPLPLFNAILIVCCLIPVAAVVFPVMVLGLLASYIVTPLDMLWYELHGKKRKTDVPDTEQDKQE